MGFFSGIAKGVKSVFKGVGKVFKKVGQAVKKFASSKIGKIILIAAAIWLGGAAIGAWKSGFAAVDGALVASGATGAAAPAAAEAAAAGVGAAAAEGAAATATGGLMSGTGTAVGTGTGTAVGAGSATGVIPSVGAGTAPVAAASPYASLNGSVGFSLAPETAGVGLKASSAGVGLQAAPAAITNFGAGSGGIMSAAGKAVTGAAKWMNAHPIPTLVGGQMLSSAFSPNAMDVAEQENQYRIEEEQRRQAEIDQANSRLEKVGGVPTWQYSGAKLPPTGQVPAAGIIGKRLVMGG